MNLNTVTTPELIKLRNDFLSRGFDIRLVGGVVRDLACGRAPKDIDLCTDATPEEQIAIYSELGYRYFETGLAHGTLSVRAGAEIYEITSLRTESDHDGRHAVVSYTRDWMDDLGRRDLTFNAMSLTFDGILIDPFGGLDDLKNGVVRFVGDPDARMTEDYLRILRWLRFHGRFASDRPLDAETVEAALRCSTGLSGISRERVWLEFAKIIAGDGAVGLVDSLYDLGLAGPIGLPLGNVDVLAEARCHTRNPVTLTYALVNSAVGDLATQWKWSSEERDFALFLNRHTKPADIDFYSWAQRLVAYDGFSVEWVSELLLLAGRKSAVEALSFWSVPVFPVKGQDLLDQGMKPGPEMGQRLKAMKLDWADTSYTKSKAQLLDQ
jgi:tRNA nucleotidyltransferase (CCA-adding enzyme)